MAETKVDNADVHEMARYMSLVEQRNGSHRRIIDEKRSDPEQAKRRVLNITAHLYRHIQRLSADDLARGLTSMTEAIYASQTIDGLYEAFQQGDRDQIVQLGQQLHEHISPLDEEQIAQIIGPHGFRGEEIDVYGLVQTLGHALHDMEVGPKQLAENSSAPSYFANLVRDAAMLITEWSKPTIVQEGEIPEPKTSIDCAEELRQLLEEKYGIVVEGSG